MTETLNEKALEAAYEAAGYRSDLVRHHIKEAIRAYLSALSPAPQEAELLGNSEQLKPAPQGVEAVDLPYICDACTHHDGGTCRCHPPVPAVTGDKIEAASYAYNEIFRSFGSHEAAIEAALQTAQEVKLEEHWREIKQHPQPSIADGYTAVSISKPGYWFVKGPGPAALQAAQEAQDG